MSKRSSHVLDAVLFEQKFRTVFDSQVLKTGNTCSISLDAKIIIPEIETIFDAILNKPGTLKTFVLDAIVLKGQTTLMDAILTDTDRQHKSVAVGTRSPAWRTAIFKQDA